MMNQLISKILGVTLIAAAPVAPSIAQAQAQAPVAITVGTQVTDTQGALVGTVVSVRGDNVSVKTDKHEVLLPKSSFTPSNGKLLFGMTQAQLNAEFEKNSAAAAAALAVGATVVGLQGTPVGVIESMDDQNVTIKLASGKTVALSRSGLRGNADGTVTIGMTAEQLSAAVDKAAGNGGTD